MPRATDGPGCGARPGGSVQFEAMEDQAPALDAPTTHGRWSTAAWLGCSVLLVLLVLGVWLRVDHDRAGANLSNAIIAGKRPDAPALSTRTLHANHSAGVPSWYRADGDSQSRTARGAQVMVVNWWASWCGPCEDEAPVLRDVAHDYRGRVTVVGMDAGSKDLKRDAREFANRHHLDEDLVLLRGDRADEDAWGVSGFPETFVVGTDGRISSYVNGPIDDETLRGLLDHELKEHRS
ncbi:MAG: Redoxin domain protein [Thermoleophilia bacterium]|nr:Redoxin domain protein [Thermoleophilia bacterium]